jgi:hypothetical protein
MAAAATEQVGARSSAPARGTSRRRHWPPTLAFVVGLGLTVWGFSIGLGRLSDNSFFTHLATGRFIVGGGGIPTHDIYSFTAKGDPWVVQSWLASVLYGWVDSWWGGQGIRVLMGLTTAFITAMTWRLTRPARTLVGRIVITALVLAVGTAVWSPRPLLIGLAMLVISLVVAEGELPPWVLLPAFWVWVNTHGSFPLGLVALGCLWIGRRADQQDASVELRALLWAVGGTVLGVLNPLGLSLLFFPLHLLGKTKVLQNIIEWQSPQFSSTWARLFLVQVGVAIVLLVRRPSYRAAIPLVVFTAAALLGERNVPVAALVMVPGMAYGFAGVGSLRGKERGPVSVVALVAVLVVAALLTVNDLGQPAYDLSTFPVAAIAWTQQHGLHRPDLRMVTTDTTGNYLELLYGRNAGAFMDDRVDMYPTSVVDDYLVLNRGEPGWEQVLDKHQADLVLWDRTAPIVGLMTASPEWRVLYQDPGSVLLCRRGVALSAQLGTC